jgi:hypothetical protein
VAYFFGESKKMLKLQKTVMRLSSNAGRDREGTVKDIKYTPSAMRVYRGDCILHKNEHRFVRAEFS